MQHTLVLVIGPVVKVVQRDFVPHSVTVPIPQPVRNLHDLLSGSPTHFDRLDLGYVGSINETVHIFADKVTIDDEKHANPWPPVPNNVPKSNDYVDALKTMLGGNPPRLPGK